MGAGAPLRFGMKTKAVGKSSVSSFETTMRLAWIAEQLRMEMWSYVSTLLRQTKMQKVRTDPGTSTALAGRDDVSKFGI